MICLCTGHGCEEARPFYYDLAFGIQLEEVPTDIEQHISGCHHCQKQVAHLFKTLQEMDTQSSQEVSGPETLMAPLLALHFDYLDTPVTCVQAKPFLPTLVDKTLPIRVVTPLTAHVKVCSACRQDIETLTGLKLTARQLYRFGQFLADPLAISTKDVQVIKGLLQGPEGWRFSRLSIEQRKQVCVSKKLRDQVYRQRSLCLDGLQGPVPSFEQIPCQDLSATDLFDWVLPYGAGEDSTLEETADPLLGVHLSTCPWCLQQLQQLHLSLFGIADRQKSRIVTIYERDEAETVVSNEKPVIVRVCRTPQSRLLGSFVRAAACVVIVVGLFFLTRSPQAVAVSQDVMLQALLATDNIHVVRREVTSGHVMQQLWYARPSQQVLMEQKGMKVLWDGKENVRKIRSLTDDSVRTEVVPHELMQTVLAPLQNNAGLLPQNYQVIPSVQWIEPEDSEKSGASGDHKIHVLQWCESTPDGRVLLQRVLYHLDPLTHLPVHVEQFEQDPDSQESELRFIIDVTYPSDQEIVQVMASFLDTP